jgi:hypothetical protein
MNWEKIEDSKDSETVTWMIANTMVNITLHRKLQIEQHKPH